MNRWIRNIIIGFVLITGVLGTPVISHAEEKAELIAGEGETLLPQPVGEEGMIPVYGEDVKDGVYSIEVESSSSMFRIVDAQLNVVDGNMTAVLTLSGKGYLKLYMGTGEQAVEKEEADYIPFVEAENGAYTYTIPVEALNLELECTAFSKRKEKWYDRQIVFRADTLPQEALLKPIKPAHFDVKNGNYTIDVSLAGGSGRAHILSPATVTITENVGIASIEWGSPYYDYMIVNGEKLYPVNTEGNSVFEVPIWMFDQEMLVIADTTVMSTPHEIEYSLTFYSDTLKRQGSGIVIAGCIVILCLGAIIIGVIYKKKVHNG